MRWSEHLLVTRRRGDAEKLAEGLAIYSWALFPKRVAWHSTVTLSCSGNCLFAGCIHSNWSPNHFGASAHAPVKESVERELRAGETHRYKVNLKAGEFLNIVLEQRGIDHSSAVDGSQIRIVLSTLADKGMRILTATQAANFAIESGSIGHGLLTFALIKEGLAEHAADFKPHDQTISLNEWLEFAAQRVPTLYEEILGGKLKTINRAELIDGGGKNSYQQQPMLFNFATKRGDPMLVKL